MRCKCLRGCNQYSALHLWQNTCLLWEIQYMLKFYKQPKTSKTSSQSSKPTELPPDSNKAKSERLLNKQLFSVAENTGVQHLTEDLATSCQNLHFISEMAAPCLYKYVWKIFKTLECGHIPFPHSLAKYSFINGIEVFVTALRKCMSGLLSA